MGGNAVALAVRLLGGFAVAVGGRPIPDADWRLRKASAIVKLLALAPGHRLHREQLLEALWPDLDTRAALNNLYYALHTARRVLGPAPPGAAYLAARREHVELAPGLPVHVDVAAFRDAARAASTAAGPEPVRRALDLYGGELLPEDRYEEWSVGEREALTALYLQLTVELAARAEAAGDPAGAVAAWRLAVGADPLDEAPRAGLLRALARAGQREAAAHSFGEYRELLRRELDAEPGAEMTRLAADIAAGRFPPRPREPASAPRRPAPTPHNLPAPLTTFVGREAELAGIAAGLESDRLLTLTGAGGCGKTRLATEAAGRLLSRFPAGVWLVELAGVREPDGVLPAVAAAVGLRDAGRGEPLGARIAAQLRRGASLLVLDSCEHLLDAASVAADALLRGCPDLRVLATSRSPLEVMGEVIRQVPPLEVPPAPRPSDETDPAALLANDAVVLFGDRARRVDAAFRLDASTAPAVAEVCRRLDGIPLAIELAAAQTRLLPLAGIVERLGHRFDLLAGGNRAALPRHRTLRATVEWSDQLLSTAGRALLRRLSVFAGTFDRDAASAVCLDTTAGFTEFAGEVSEIDAATGGPPPPPTLPPIPGGLDVLEELARQSLVIEVAPAARYRLLDTIREYAREHLDCAEARPLAARFAAYYAALAHAATGAREWAETEARYDRLEAQADNLNAALAWSRTVDGPADDVARPRRRLAHQFAAWLRQFWDSRGHYDVGRAHTDAVAESPAPDVTPTLRVKTLQAAGRLASQQHDLDAAGRWLRLALDLAEVDGDARLVAGIHQTLGGLAIAAGDFAAAREHYEHAHDRFRRLGSDAMVAIVLGNLAVVARNLGEFDRAESHQREALRLHTALGNLRGVAVSRNNLGNIAWSVGDLDTAQREYAASVQAARDAHDAIHEAVAVSNLGLVARYRGDLATARSHYEAGLPTFREKGLRAAVARSVNELGLIALARGDTTAALDLLRAALRERAEIDDRTGVAESLEALADLTTDVAAAARWVGAAVALREATGYRVTPIEQPAWEARLQRLRRAVGQTGGGLGADPAPLLADVVAEALGDA